MSKKSKSLSFVSDEQVATMFSNALTSLLADGYEFHFHWKFDEPLIISGAFLLKDGQLYLLVLHDVLVKMNEVGSIIERSAYSRRISLLKLGEEAQHSILTKKWFPLHLLFEEYAEEGEYASSVSYNTVGYAISTHSSSHRIVLKDKKEVLEALKKLEARSSRNLEEKILLSEKKSFVMDRESIRYSMLVNSAIPGFKKKAMLYHTDEGIFLVSATGNIERIARDGISCFYVSFGFKHKELLKTITRA